MRRDHREQRRLGAQDVGRDEVTVPGQRADRDGVAVEPDVGRLGDAADVDERGREREAQLHHRQQRVAAGEQLGLVAVLAEQRDGLVDRVGAHVVEGGGNHALAPLRSRDAASTARTMLW